MTNLRKNRIKAIFLLIVFSLNTIAGFACSIGLDMGYNSHHHEQDKHVHEKSHKQRDVHNSNHHHLHFGYSNANFSICNPGDDCCANQVYRFAKLDKSIVHNNLLLKAPISPISSVPKFNPEEKDEPGRSVNSRFQFVRRSCSLDDTDIRIAIQSFQI